MRAIAIREPGDENVLVLSDVPRPTLGAADVRIRVRTTAINRADLLQRQGLYPPPPGASPIPGLECAGEVTELGSHVEGLTLGQHVMALLSGGGYAEEAVVHHGSVLPVPTTLTEEEAGAFVEVFLTAFSNLFMPELGRLGANGAALVHGGGGGVGTAAISLLKETGNPCFVTVGSDEKARGCLELGATAVINYRTESFADRIKELTKEQGVDVVLDHIGAKYLSSNLAVLRVGGRLVEIGLMGGLRSEINLADLLIRRLSVIGSTLRSRTAAEKAAIVEAFLARCEEALNAGRLKPVVDTVLPLEQAAEGHRRMQSSEHFGKIVLRVG